MNYIFFALIIFTLGITTYALGAIIKYPKKMIQVFLTSGIMTILTTIVMLTENNFNIFVIGICFILIYVLALFVTYQNEIVPVINERVVFVATIIFWYILIITRDSIPMFILEKILPIGGVMTIGSIFMLIYKRDNPFLAKIISYVWYLSVLLASVIIFTTSNNYDFIFNLEASVGDFPYYFISGIFCMFIISNLMPILLLLPGKKDEAGDLKKRWMFVSSRINNQQFRNKDFLVYIAITFILTFNLFIPIINQAIITNLIFIFSPMLLKDNEKKIIKN